MSITDMSRRNETIYRLWAVNKMTMAAIGRRYSLSRERVRQIIRMMEA